MMWTNPENVKLHERSQTLKTTHCVIPFTEMPRTGTPADRYAVAQGWESEGTESGMANRYGGSFWGDENVRKSLVVMEAQL